MTNFIIAFIIIVVLIILYYYLRFRKRNKLTAIYLEKKTNFDMINDKLIHELERTKNISKNEESIKLYVTWKNEYDVLFAHLQDINFHIDEMVSYNNFKQHKQFIEVSSILEGLVFEFATSFDELLKKVKQYTEFELENTRISLTLKETIKVQCQKFDHNLKFLEIYTTSFNAEIAEANALIAEFEGLQTRGDYPAGRNVLRKCNRILENVGYNYKIIDNFRNYLTQIQSDIDTIVKVNEEIENIGFKINVSNFQDKVTTFSNSRESFLAQIAELDFSTTPNEDVLKDIRTRFSALDNEISEFKDIVEEKFKFISDIINIMEDNEKLIDTTNEIISGAKQEQEEIIKLYEVPNIKQIQQLNDYFEEYDQFIKDYKKLLNIIMLAKEDYARLKGRIQQANHYLVRLLKNLEASIQQLKAIRQDELDAFENLDYYKLMSVEFDLYLRKYEHTQKLEKNLGTLLKEYNLKLQSLEENLDNEPLNIANVRNINDALTKIIEQLVDKKDLEKDIKQRIGCEFLIKYLNQFNTNDDINIVIKRLQNLYNANEYRTLLVEAYGLLKNNSSKADKIYESILGQVEVDEFKPVLVNEK